jgi:hypothetical protein
VADLLAALPVAGAAAAVIAVAGAVAAAVAGAIVGESRGERGHDNNDEDDALPCSSHLSREARCTLVFSRPPGLREGRRGVLRVFLDSTC